jgi:hypothetical protein
MNAKRLPVTPFLRRVLLADAAISGATGVAMIVGANALEARLGVPAWLLRSAGIAFLPFAAMVWLAATRASLPRGAVLAVIVLNVLWAVECVLLLATGWLDPTPFGVAFIVAQAITVVVLAELEWVGLRRAVLAAG